ncbi:hypothetical protein CPLU01_07629 [Colletotrichum plurivorum]|uniref:Uncharacterized protein n=1 Tax=Colletotrichum plurivorum TaxID=2175906 RepID=A0A8H6NE45_9PEZI|nr:hypothetical protein CPLU01_07629 [Colletotrichum plurivorum]
MGWDTERRQNNKDTGGPLWADGSVTPNAAHAEQGAPTLRTFFESYPWALAGPRSLALNPVSLAVRLLFGIGFGLPALAYVAILVPGERGEPQTDTRTALFSAVNLVFGFSGRPGRLLASGNCPPWIPSSRSQPAIPGVAWRQRPGRHYSATRPFDIMAANKVV